MRKIGKRSMGIFAAVVFGMAGLFAHAPGALAQDGGTAQLRGVVFDSTAMGALAGARVAVFGTNVTGQTDADGRFVLRGIPAGSHWVSFYHDRLQELGVSAPSRQVAFGDGERVSLELTVPSPETLLLGWCLASSPTQASPRSLAL